MSNLPATRHIKCDEAPGVCNNCTSTGRKCDGYDMARLPIQKLALSSQPNIGPRLAWFTTTDERRCFSYFMHCSIPSLATFFDSPLWQRVALQMSHVDRAVYHAANVLGALHEDSDQNLMRLSGENLERPRHRLALDQASRAFAILSQRQVSHDPQFEEIVLLCCLLFVISDLLLAQYDSAFRHLRGGLQILGEAQQRRLHGQRHVLPVDSSLVQTFQRLDIESSHFGSGGPFLFSGNEPDDCYEPILYGLQDVHQEVTRSLNMGIPFLANCWPLSAAEIEADFEYLYRKQQSYLSFNSRLQLQIQTLSTTSYHKFTYSERRKLDLSLLQCQGQLLALRTCLIDGPVPAYLTPEYEALLVASEAIMAKFSERPTVTLDYGIVPGLYVVASRCPDYSIRLRAIDAMLSWPHCEAIVNSNVTASMALQILKTELQVNDQRGPWIVDRQSEEELNRFLFKTLNSTHTANWSMTKSLNI
ncbi:hypothetical protein BJX99DRAFT_244709 [Aspergillus californicus]